MAELNEQEVKDLLEVWKTLDILRVSLGDLGMYEALHGKEKSQKALREFFTPEIYKRIAESYGKLTSFFETCDPRWLRKLERISQKELDSLYWNGPKEDTE